MAHSRKTIFPSLPKKIPGSLKKLPESLKKLSGFPKKNSGISYNQPSLSERNARNYNYIITGRISPPQPILQKGPQKIPVLQKTTSLEKIPSPTEKRDSPFPQKNSRVETKTNKKVIVPKRPSSRVLPAARISNSPRGLSVTAISPSSRGSSVTTMSSSPRGGSSVTTMSSSPRGSSVTTISSSPRASSTVMSFSDKKLSIANNACPRLERTSSLQKLQDKVADLEQKHKQYEQMIKSLIELNTQKDKILIPAEVEHKDKQQSSYDKDLIHYAARGDLEKVKAVVLLGANINSVDQQGETALFHSILNQHSDVTNFLLDQKPDFEIRNKDGKTILHKVCETNTPDLVEATLEIYPIDDREAKTLFSILEMKNILPTIKTHIANKILLQGAKQNSVLLVEKALANGANVNVVGSCKETALHKACDFKYLDIVRVLLKNQSKILLKNQNNQTPFDLLGKGDDDDAIRKELAGTIFKRYYKQKLYLKEERLKERSQVARDRWIYLSQYDKYINLLTLFKNKRFMEAEKIIEQDKEEIDLLLPSSSFSSTSSLSKGHQEEPKDLSSSRQLKG